MLTHLLVPTGTKELSGDTYGSINKLAASHQINESLDLGCNLGYNYLGTGRGDLTYSLVPGVAVNEKVGMYIEPYGELLDMLDFMLSSDTGLTYPVKENLQLDFSFGTGMNHRMNFISLGCSWKIMGAH